MSDILKDAASHQVLQCLLGQNQASIINIFKDRNIKYNFGILFDDPLYNEPFVHQN